MTFPSIAEMMARTAQQGRVEAIFLRPSRREKPISVDNATVTEAGLLGDHAPVGKRAVTLIQDEHISVIATLLARGAIDPADLRRNLVISGLNLYAFRKNRIQIGDAILETSGPCPPCSRMEEVLGFGGYNAMRGHGGVYASVVQAGDFSLGAKVSLVSGQ